MDKGKQPSSPTSLADDNPSISNDIVSEGLARIEKFFTDTRFSSPIPPNLSHTDAFSDLFRSCLKVQSTQRGKISCLVTVKLPILNLYGGMHGGAVASVAQLVSEACARTVVGKDKEVFLGELSTSYLSAAPNEAKVIVDGSVVRSGRNITVVAVEFKIEGSNKLVYSSRATLYHLPAASL
ncbi:hypothetical protein ACH5RR_024021 [Cinchona calisaya]|uniref:Thioesterase domain-containing protein n=1 Tax=Cinchona calisaya TaxID=153742 RepID=A0ABD2ZDP6_9GENT